MPMPPELEAFLGNRPPAAFNASAARPEYDDWADTWQLYADLAELDPPKIKKMLDMHVGESTDKYAIRQKLACVFNMVPSILNMMKAYLFADEPMIETGGDPDLDAFLDDCTGTRVPYKQFVRQRVLPAALTYGWVDGLVQNPFVRPPPGDGDPAETTAAAPADGTEGGSTESPFVDPDALRPALILITPLQRISWAVRQNDVYNWVRFKDIGHETHDPFAMGVRPEITYLTISAAIPNITPRAFWVRSTQVVGEGDSAARWNDDGDWFPTVRAPLVTLYYQQSNNPETPHFGVSKISMIAVLTRLIVQVLSWTAEDVLASLGLLAAPSQGGKRPTDEEGKEKISRLTSMSILWYDVKALTAPHWLQGSVEHIDAKLRLIDLIIREIMRIAHMSAAMGEAGVTTSGVHGFVERTELFKELADLAVGMDTFTLDCFALVKSWRTNAEVTRQDIIDAGAVVSFCKGPYAVDDLAVMVANAVSLQDVYRRVSPTLCKSVLRQLAQVAIPPDDPNRATIMKEIEDNSVAEVDRQNAASDLLTGALANADAAKDADAGVAAANAGPSASLPDAEAVAAKVAAA